MPADGRPSAFSVLSNDRREEQIILKNMLLGSSFQPHMINNDIISFKNPDVSLNTKTTCFIPISDEPRETLSMKPIKVPLQRAPSSFFGFSFEEDEDAHLQGYLMKDKMSRNSDPMMYDVVGSLKIGTSNEHGVNPLTNLNDDKRKKLKHKLTAGPMPSPFPVLKVQYFEAFIKDLDWRNSTHELCRLINVNAFTRNDIVREISKNVIECKSLASYVLNNYSF